MKKYNIIDNLLFFITCFFVGYIESKLLVFINITGFIEILVSIVCIVLLNIIAIYFASLVHELGHYIFGSIVGYRLSCIKLGHFVIYKKQNKVVVKKILFDSDFIKFYMYPKLVCLDKNKHLLFWIGGCLLDIAFIAVFVYIRKFVWLIYAYFIDVASIIIAYKLLISVLPIDKYNKNDFVSIIELYNNEKFIAVYYSFINIISKLMKSENGYSELTENDFNVLMFNNFNNVYFSNILIYKCAYLINIGKIDESYNYINYLVDNKLYINETDKYKLDFYLFFINIIRKNGSQNFYRLCEHKLDNCSNSNNLCMLSTIISYAYSLLYVGDLNKAFKDENKIKKMIKKYPNCSCINFNKYIVNCIKGIYYGGL